MGINTTMKEVKNGKGQLSQLDINNTFFFYTQFGDRKNPIYDERNLPKNKQTRFEQSVQFLVSEEVADRLEEIAGKTSIKKFTSKAKLLEKMKVDDPSLIPDDKKYFVVKLVQKLQNRDGSNKDARLLPRAFKLDDGKAVEITFSEAVGNGSKGNIRITVSSNPDYGTFLYPKMVLVTDLVEYSNDEDLSDFLGDVEIVTEEAPMKAESDLMDDLDDAPFETEDEDDVY